MNHIIDMIVIPTLLFTGLIMPIEAIIRGIISFIDEHKISWNKTFTGQFITRMKWSNIKHGNIYSDVALAAFFCSLFPFGFYILIRFVVEVDAIYIVIGPAIILLFILALYIIRYMRRGQKVLGKVIKTLHKHKNIDDIEEIDIKIPKFK